MSGMGQTLRSAGRRLIGDTLLGTIDYYRDRELRKAWGGPFNGQLARRALFNAIVRHIQPLAIVETGTYLGTTTEFLALTGLPVFTIEADSRRFGFARARFWSRSNVTLLRGDSRTNLKGLFTHSLRRLADGPLFFYLDAHWNDDLPLAEELNLVFSGCAAAVVMIDDFQVPFDSGYGYDDYGPDKALVPSYIAPAVSNHGLRVFYPSTSSVNESGARRGCVVLAKHSAVVASLSAVSLLKVYSSGTPDANATPL
jgi:hypothetical protein